MNQLLLWSRTTKNQRKTHGKDDEAVRENKIQFGRNRDE